MLRVALLLVVTLASCFAQEGKLRIIAIVDGRDRPGRVATVFLTWEPEERAYRVVGLEH